MAYGFGDKANGRISGSSVSLPARPGAVDPKAQQIDIFPLDAWEFDDPKTHAVPRVRLRAPWVFHGGSIEVGSIGAEQINVSALFAEEITVPTGGAIRYETGSGVQKRCVQLADEKIDWLDTPDTTPASPEQLRARIGRLGVGGSILMDGEFLANIDSTLGDESYIATGSSLSPYTGCAKIIEVNGVERVAYRGASNLIVEQKKPVGGTWGAAYSVSSMPAGDPTYVQDKDGSVWLAYSASTGIYYKKDTGYGYGSEGVVALDDGSRPIEPVLFNDLNNKVAVAYSKGGYIYIVENDDGSWPSGTPLFVGNGPCVIHRNNGSLRLSVYDALETYPQERTSTAHGVWSAPTDATGVAAFDYIDYFEDISGRLGLLYLGEFDSHLYRSFYDDGAGTWSTPEKIVASVCYSPNFLRRPDGNLDLSYMRSDGTYVYAFVERTLQRYARVGAGIVAEGSNAYGKYVVFGNGWCVCCGARATPVTATTYNYPVTFAAKPNLVFGYIPYGSISAFQTAWSNSVDTYAVLGTNDINVVVWQANGYVDLEDFA